jgi:hypothetical protein
VKAPLGNVLVASSTRNSSSCGNSHSRSSSSEVPVVGRVVWQWALVINAAVEWNYRGSRKHAPTFSILK